MNQQVNLKELYMVKNQIILQLHFFSLYKHNYNILLILLEFKNTFLLIFIYEFHFKHIDSFNK